MPSASSFVAAVAVFVMLHLLCCGAAFITWVGLKVQRLSGPITEIIDPFGDSAARARKATRSRHFPGLRLLLRKRPVEGVCRARRGAQIRPITRAEKVSNLATFFGLGQARRKEVEWACKPSCRSSSSGSVPVWWRFFGAFSGSEGGPAAEQGKEQCDFSAPVLGNLAPGTALFRVRATPRGVSLRWRIGSTSVAL